MRALSNAEKRKSQSQRKRILFLARKPFFSDFFFFIGTKTRDVGRIDKNAIDGGEGKSVR